MAPPVDPPVADETADAEHHSCNKWCVCSGRCDVRKDDKHQMLRHGGGSADGAGDAANCRSKGGCHFEALQSVDTTPRTAVLTTSE